MPTPVGILDIHFVNGGSDFLRFLDEESLNARIQRVMEDSTSPVRSLTLYRPTQTITRSVKWDRQLHPPVNNRKE